MPKAEKPKRRCKLTKEEKKAAWANPKQNAGAGWQPIGNGEPPRRFVPNRERDTTPEVDREFK